MLCVNDSSVPVKYTYLGAEKVLLPKQRLGLSGAEADYIAGLKVAGVRVGPEKEAGAPAAAGKAPTVAGAPASAAVVPPSGPEKA
jgi:hypothetical protein